MANANVPQVDVGAQLSRAWTLFTENTGAMLAASGAAVGLMVAVFVLNFVSGVLGTVMSLVLWGPILFGCSVIALKAVRGQHPEPADVLAGFQQHLVPSIIAGALISIFSTIGLLLCFFPGLLVCMIYMLTFFYQVDEKLDGWAAMEKSRTVVMENIGAWLVAFLVYLALGIVGVLACGVGLLVTFPLALVFLALVYDSVAGAMEVHAEPYADDANM